MEQHRLERSIQKTTRFFTITMQDMFGKTEGYIVVRNRRSEPRFSANQAVSVSRPDEPHSLPVNGEIIDYSNSGLAIIIPVEATPASRLLIEWPLGSVLAEVRNCRRLRPGAYRVGLALREIIARAEIHGDTNVA